MRCGVVRAALRRLLGPSRFRPRLTPLSSTLQPPELMFLETSARTGENVEEVFLKCARTILAKIESGETKQLEKLEGAATLGKASLSDPFLTF